MNAWNISNQRSFASSDKWQVRYLQDTLQRRTKKVWKIGGFWFWVNLCKRRKLLLLHRDYEVDRDACNDMSFEILSILIQDSIFFYETDPHHLFLSIITALDGSASQNTAQKKMKFIEVETAIKIKFCALLEQLNQRHTRAESKMDLIVDCIVDSGSSIYLPSSCKCKESISRLPVAFWTLL